MRSSFILGSWLSPAALVVVASTLAAPAFGQVPVPIGPPPLDPNLREVSMVHQDFSDCTNGDISDHPPAVVGGTARVVRGSDGQTSVRIGITAKPNTTYHFFLKCIRILGDIVTYDEGVGEAQFTFSTTEAGNVFAFDMYPEGAPAGNKYQSVQVKY